MIKPILMPQVVQDIPDAVISRWLKRENDRVEKGEVVLIVESDKASFEIEAEYSGVLVKALYNEGERVEIFKPLAYIGDGLEPIPEESGERVPEPVEAPNLEGGIAGGTDISSRPDASRIVASPSARRMGTFIVSSLGMHGISRFLPVINPPECAILSVGCAEARAVSVADGIGVRQMMTLGLACDHRAVDGVYAASFLNRIKSILETVPLGSCDAPTASDSRRPARPASGEHEHGQGQEDPA